MAEINGLSTAGIELKTTEHKQVPVIQCVQTLEGHGRDVTSCCFHDSSILASGSSDKTIRIWKISETLTPRSNPTFVEELISPLSGHSYAVNSVSFAPQRALLASGSTDGTVFLWDPKLGEKVACLRHESGAAVRCCVFSPNGDLLASTGDDGSVCIWELVNFSLAKKLDVEDAEASAETAEFSLEGSCLIVGTSTGRLVAFSSDPQSVHSIPVSVHKDAHDLGVTCLSFNRMNSDPSNKKTLASPRNQIMATGGQDGLVRLWDVEVSSWKGTAEVRPWEVELKGHSGAVMCVRFHNLEKLIFSAGGDKTVRVWNWSKGTCIAVCQGHQRYVTTCTVSSDGSWLATGSNDRTVKIWRLCSSAEMASPIEPLRKSHSELWSVPGARLVQPTACWTVDDVCDWLDDLGLGPYTPKFREMNVTGVELTGINGKKLEAVFGMSNETHRVRLLSEYQQLMKREFKANGDSRSTPVEFFCPITHNLMAEPVLAKDGYTYEKSAIQEWFAKRRTSPLTNQVMVSTELIPNLTLKALINRHMSGL